MDVEVRAMQTHWWTLLLRGIVAVIFGIAAVFWPHITLLTLLYLFAAWVLIDGVVRMVTGITRIGEHQLGFLTLLVGLLELGAGVYLLRHPHVTFATLILIIGFLLIISGVIEVAASLFSGEGTTSKTLTVIIGAIAVIAGIILFFQPARSGVAFVWILGLYALIAGPILIAESLELRNISDRSARE